MSPRSVAVSADEAPRRHGVFGALAAALPDRGGRRAAEQRPDLRVVETTSRRRRSWQVGTVAGGLLFLAMFVIVGAQTLIVQQQRHIDDVNSRITVAEAQAEQLKIDLAELQSPERIVTEATDKLGMVPAPSPVYLTRPADADARAAEVPPASPSTTVAAATTAASSSSAATTKAGTSSTAGARSGR